VSALGEIRLDRAYYYCPACCGGSCPSDADLQLTSSDQTPGAEQLIALTGVLDSFATAAKTALRQLTGLRLSESTVQRTTEAVGERLGERLESGQTLGGPTPWDWHRDAEGKTCAYVSVDATGVPQQGPNGAKTEGRMANVAMIYNPVPDEREQWANPEAKREPEWQGRYLAGLSPTAEQLQQLRVVGAQVGMDDAQRWIGLSDGGLGLEDALRVNFPRVEVVILDFWHAAEHLHEFAKEWQPGEGGEALAATWCHQMKHEGGTAVLKTIQALSLSGKRPAAREAHRELVVYLENQQHRMDYPTYRQKGWQIGSGPVESACKRVVGQRLKGTGMRWSEAGSDAVCHLRALLCSADHQWESFWQRAA